MIDPACIHTMRCTAKSFVAGLRRMIGGNSECLGVVGKGGSAPPLPNKIKHLGGKNTH